MAATYQPSQWLIPENSNTDKVGNYSFEFDGSATKIQFPITPTGSPATDCTFSAWARRDSTGNMFLFGNQNTYGYGAYFNGVANLYLKETALSLLTFSSAAIQTALARTDWVHWTFIRDTTAGTYAVYVDGALAESQVTASTNGMSGVDTIGGSGLGAGTQYIWDGLISEVCIFDYALSADQVTTLYGSAGAGVGNPMALDVVPVAYYKGDKAALGDQWAVANQVSQDYVFDFDGSSYIDLTTPYALGVTSVSFWMNSSDTTNGGVTLGLGNLTFVGTTPLLRLGSANYKYFADQSANFDGNWHHWFFLITGALDDDVLDAKMFVDGVEIAGGSTANHGSPSAWTVSEIGSSPWGGQKVAKITEFAIWQSDQTANISTIYNNGTPGDLTSLSPTGWWQLNSSATFSTNWNIPDASSGSNTGTSAAMTQASLVPSTVTRGTAMYSNYSFDFDGVGDYFDCGDSNSFTFGNGTTDSPFSISVWVYFDSVSGTKGIVSKYGGSSAVQEWMMYFSSSNIRFLIKDASSGKSCYASGGTTLLTGQWYNFVGTYNGVGGSSAGDGIKIYLNGVEETLTVTNNASYVAMENTTQPFEIGRYSTNYLQGKISNMAIWDSALSAANVLAIYNSGRPADLTLLSPVAWWRLGEDAFASTTAPTAWTTPDQIGSNDGTSSGSPTLVGDAPQSFANGLSVSMDIEDRIGESGFSDLNALSYNMPKNNRKAY